MNIKQSSKLRRVWEYRICLFLSRWFEFCLWLFLSRWLEFRLLIWGTEKLILTLYCKFTLAFLLSPLSPSPFLSNSHLSPLHLSLLLCIFLTYDFFTHLTTDHFSFFAWSKQRTCVEYGTFSPICILIPPSHFLAFLFFSLCLFYSILSSTLLYFTFVERHLLFCRCIPFLSYIHTRWCMLQRHCLHTKCLSLVQRIGSPLCSVSTLNREPA